METTKTEFDTFWSEVLGSDWYLDEPSFDDEEFKFVLDDSAIRYQGTGHRPDTPPPFVKAQEIGDYGMLEVGVATLFKRWHLAQTTTFIVAEFRVPKEEAEALRRTLTEMGGKL
jgi:hypothetical protein